MSYIFQKKLLHKSINFTTLCQHLWHFITKFYIITQKVIQFYDLSSKLDPMCSKINLNMLHYKIFFKTYTVAFITFILSNYLFRLNRFFFWHSKCHKQEHVDFYHRKKDKQKLRFISNDPVQAIKLKNKRIIK